MTDRAARGRADGSDGKLSCLCSPMDRRFRAGFARRLFLRKFREHFRGERPENPPAYSGLAPSLIHAAMTARSCSVMLVTLPSGMMRVTITCW